MAGVAVGKWTRGRLSVAYLVDTFQIADHTPAAVFILSEPISAVLKPPASIRSSDAGKSSGNGLF